MNDGFSWWLVVLGIAVGIGLVWLFTVRLPVTESDVDAEETAEEAAWICQTIESWGGVAPTALVQEVLELHQRYLDGDRSPAAFTDEASDATDGGPAAAEPTATDPSAAALRPPDAPPTGTSSAAYAPPAYPPAGRFAELPPPPMPRAEPD
jgi:hypothetical protein